MRIAAFRSTPAGISPVLDLSASTVACFMEFFFFLRRRRKKERQAEKDKGESEIKTKSYRNKVKSKMPY